MRYSAIQLTILASFLACQLWGCDSSESSEEAYTDSSAESDSDADVDGDSDADVDGDSDADADGDSDTDTDADTDGDSDADADSDGDGSGQCRYKEYNTTGETFAKQLCCLCKDCEIGITERLNMIIDSSGLTCGGMEFDMFDATPGSETCHEMQNQYRDVCCNPDCTPPPVEVNWDPVELPFDQGEHPNCDLCKRGGASNGQYPLLPFTITAIAYVPGNPRCVDLYWMGRTGNIPVAMCYPIQNFMEEPCGCLPPNDEYPKGREPHCDLCPNGHYPFRPGTQPRGLEDLGSPLCVDVYWMGRQGQIPASRCQQLQKELRDPCGCL